MPAKNVIGYTVYLRPDQINWLKKNPQFNMSGWIRLKLDKRIEDEIFLLDR